jgi:hypothetical protein
MYKEVLINKPFPANLTSFCFSDDFIDKSQGGVKTHEKSLWRVSDVRYAYA